MHLSRGTFATLALAGALALTGCEDAFAPCGLKGDAEKLDGIWALTTINHAAVPAKGYQVTSSEYLVAGSVEFKTRSVIGDCKDPESYSGVVIIRYAIMNAAGQLQTGKTYTGSFDYNLRRQMVLFRSSRNWIEGPKTGNTISVAGLVPSTWTQVSIEFNNQRIDI